MKWEDICEDRGGTFTVYHGTETEFSMFSDDHLGSANGTAPINMTGFNFTDSLEVARTFGNRVIKARVKIDHPRTINAKGMNYSEFKHILNSRLEKTNRSKYDGIIIRNYMDAGPHGEYMMSNHYIPFSVNQITVLDDSNEDRT